MNSQLLVLLFTIVFGAVLLLVFGAESLLSVPQVRGLGQNNVFVIAPSLLIIATPLFTAAKRKYVLPPHHEKRVIALLSVAALGGFMVIPTAIIGIRSHDTFERFCAAAVVICYSYLTCAWTRDALRRTRGQ